MNSHTEIQEPRTAAELIARYREVRRRLYSPATPPKLVNSETRTDSAPCTATAPIPGPSREPEPPPSETPFQHQTPAREALQAVSTRTCVPIADILGRNRRPPIAAARHEAVWRVRLATGEPDGAVGEGWATSGSRRPGLPKVGIWVTIRQTADCDQAAMNGARTHGH